jgi:hypothetical protein
MPPATTAPPITAPTTVVRMWAMFMVCSSSASPADQPPSKVRVASDVRLTLFAMIAAQLAAALTGPRHQPVSGERTPADKRQSQHHECA